MVTPAVLARGHSCCFRTWSLLLSVLARGHSFCCLSQHVVPPTAAVAQFLSPQPLPQPVRHTVQSSASLPQPVRHTVQSSASSFNFQHPPFSSRPCISCLRLLPLFRSFFPSILPSITSYTTLPHQLSSNQPSNSQITAPQKLLLAHLQKNFRIFCGTRQFTKPHHPYLP